MVDYLGGETIVVSLCGLTNSAIAYRADADGVPDLAVMSAPNNNVVYRDRRCGGLVQQLLPRIAYGSGAGKMLSTLPVFYTDWSTWRQLVLVPASRLADQEYMSRSDRLLTRAMRLIHRRTRVDRRPFLAVSGGADGAVHPKTRVFALREEHDAYAYTRAFLGHRRIVWERGED